MDHDHCVVTFSHQVSKPVFSSFDFVNFFDKIEVPGKKTYRLANACLLSIQHGSICFYLGTGSKPCFGCLTLKTCRSFGQSPNNVSNM